MGLWLFTLTAALLSTSGVAAATPLPSNITSNTTLTASSSPYTGGWVTIKPGIVLTVEPGVVVKLSETLEVNGSLVVNGSALNPVTFTSVKDDSVGGDTNGDGAASNPAPGDWREIYFSSTGAGELSHADIRYGGYSKSYSDHFTMVRIQCPCANNVTIKDSSITHSQFDGLQTYRASPQVLNSDISNNGSAGLRITGGSAEITGNAIADNHERGISMEALQGYPLGVDIDGNLLEGNTGDGIRVMARTAYTRIAKASLGENTFIGNSAKPVSYEAFSNPAEDPALEGNPVPLNIDTNTVIGGTKNGIWVTGEVQESTSWQGNDYPIVIPQDNLMIGSKATLTIEPGVILKGDAYASLGIRGELVTAGSAEDPITFTSVKDDSVGGDTNGDGAASNPAPGDWGGLKYPAAVEDELNYVRFKYAKAALDIKFLDVMTVQNSDFVRNVSALLVKETANNSPALAGLACVPPYLSFVAFVHSWFSPFGIPAPNLDLSSVLGATIPEEYGPFFGPALALAAEVQPNYKGAENQIPFSIYSCPALGIPPIPVTPVSLIEPAVLPNFL